MKESTLYGFISGVSALTTAMCLDNERYGLSLLSGLATCGFIDKTVKAAREEREEEKDLLCCDYDYANLEECYDALEESHANLWDAYTNVTSTVDDIRTEIKKLPEYPESLKALFDKYDEILDYYKEEEGE